MTFGRLTTKWRIFRSDLCSENGTQKNCQIIRVAAKLHNYVINSDSLNFHNIPDSDFEGLEVERLEDGPSGNRRYLPISVEDVVMLEDTAENRDRRDYIV